ncbi:MAG: hypothetical protein PUA59_07625 [Clostridium sp.]|nr:hypothetical protein [Clostridium sp.]
MKNGNYSQEMLDGVGGDRTVLEKEADVYINEAQLDVDALQQEYETASEKPDWRDYGNGTPGTGETEGSVQVNGNSRLMSIRYILLLALVCFLAYGSLKRYGR